MRRNGVMKKPAMLASPEFAKLMSAASKQALVDALWCACRLGTTEEPHEITTQAARNLALALEQRGDRVPIGLKIVADGDYQWRLKPEPAE